MSATKAERIAALRWAEQIARREKLTTTERLKGGPVRREIRHQLATHERVLGEMLAEAATLSPQEQSNG